MGHVTVTVKDGEGPKMPDGGWGWIVVAASLCIHLIQDGIAFSFGVLFVEFTREFEASKTSASWVGSLFLSVPLITGPFMSILVDKYGCRRMTLVAGLVSATGFILSYFAKSIVVMYFTFGIISGTGLGLTYVTAIVAVAFWFDKKRNLAVGLGACGTGIGTIVYAPFTNYLVEEFGWRWSLILLAGTLLNICVGGAVMRDPDWLIKQKKEENEEKNKEPPINLIALKNLLQNDEVNKNNTYIFTDPKGLSECNDNSNHQSLLLISEVPNEQNIPMFREKLENSDKTTNHNTSAVQEKNPAAEPLLAQQNNSNSQNYLNNMMKPRRSLVYHESLIRRSKDKLTTASCPNIYKNSNLAIDKKEMNSWYSAVVDLFLLFDELHYTFISLSTVILFAWFMTPYFYLVDHMISIGYDEEKGALVLSIIGIANTIGMVGLGWLGDRSWTSVSKMYAITIILCGFSCSLLYIFASEYIWLNIFSGLYGIFLSSTFAYTPIMMMELLPIETFTKAYGLQLLCQGVGHLVGPPIAAYLADVTGSWAAAFHVSAVWIVIAGILILVVPYTKNKKMFGSGLTAKEIENANAGQ